MSTSRKTMEHKGYYAKIMEADRLIGDHTFGLPPGTPLDIYPADVFKSYPENWMKGPGVFVVPVRPNKGLWFDWRENDPYNTAIIPTIKGCNPITGMQTTGFHLEKYETKCPKHGCDFQVDRYCPECGYKWPDRSYVSMSPLWWDGWMSEGAIRQFFFTEDMMRDIASHMIGKENTVPAFGFAFYSPKVKRVKPQEVSYIYHSNCFSDVKCASHINYLSSASNISEAPSTPNIIGKKIRIRSMSKTTSMGALYSSSTFSAEKSYSPITDGDMCSVTMDALSLGERSKNFSSSIDVQKRSAYVPEKEVSIGAGAKIRQELPKDNSPLEDWKDVPDSVMTIYFVFQEEFSKMASGGFRDFTDCKDGMLKGLPVG